MIRIAKDLSMDEMAQHFMVTKAHISAIEKQKRKFSIQTLKFRLDNMNISLDDYYLVEDFSEELLSQKLSNRDKYKFMLIKTLGIVEPETKVQVDELLENFYYKKTKKIIIRKL